jgi:hypothetical protein
VVSTPIADERYFRDEPELRRLFVDYRLVGVDVMNRRNLRRSTRAAMRLAELLGLDAVMAPVWSNYVTSEANRTWPTHGIFAFRGRT